MLAPSERAKLQELLADYAGARERLLAYLEIIEEKWIQEIENDPDDFSESERMAMAGERLDIVTDWIVTIEERGVYLDELEGDIE